MTVTNRPAPLATEEGDSTRPQAAPRMASGRPSAGFSRRAFLLGAALTGGSLLAASLPGAARAGEASLTGASAGQDDEAAHGRAATASSRPDGTDSPESPFLDVARADLSSADRLLDSLASMARPVVAVDGQTITDTAGSSFVMPVSAQRVICLNSNVYDVICALGQADRVIGVNDTTEPNPSTPGVRSFGDLSKPDVEAIIEAAPDLVICYSARIDAGVASQIEAAGVTLARLDLYKPATCRAELTFLGNALGAQQEAAELLAIIEGLQALVGARVEGVGAAGDGDAGAGDANSGSSGTSDTARSSARGGATSKRGASSASDADGVSPLRTYWEIYADYKSVGMGSGGDQIMALAGVENLAHGETAAHPKVSDEWVIEANPQLIVRESSPLKGATGPGVSDPSGVEALYEALVGRPGWDAVDAVRDGRVIVLDTTITTNPLGFALAPLYVAHEAYPERLADLPAPDDVLAAMLNRYWPGQDRAGIYAYTR